MCQRISDSSYSARVFRITSVECNLNFMYMTNNSLKAFSIIIKDEKAETAAGKEFRLTTNQLTQIFNFSASVTQYKYIWRLGRITAQFSCVLLQFI